MAATIIFGTRSPLHFAGSRWNDESVKLLYSKIMSAVVLYCVVVVDYQYILIIIDLFVGHAPAS